MAFSRFLNKGEKIGGRTTTKIEFAEGVYLCTNEAN